MTTYCDAHWKSIKNFHHHKSFQLFLSFSSFFFSAAKAITVLLVCSINPNELAASSYWRVKFTQPVILVPFHLRLFSKFSVRAGDHTFDSMSTSFMYIYIVLYCNYIHCPLTIANEKFINRPAIIDIF